MDTNIIYPGFSVDHDTFVVIGKRRGQWRASAFPRLNKLNIHVFCGDASGIKAAGHDCLVVELKGYERWKTAQSVCRQAADEDWTGLMLFEVLSGKRRRPFFKRFVRGIRFWKKRV